MYAVLLVVKCITLTLFLIRTTPARHSAQCVLFVPVSLPLKKIIICGLCFITLSPSSPSFFLPNSSGKNGRIKINYNDSYDNDDNDGDHNHNGYNNNNNYDDLYYYNRNNNYDYCDEINDNEQ